MKIYHGTISSCAENIIKNGIDLTKGKPKVDFGPGFYTTKSYHFASSTAKNKAEKTNLYFGEIRVLPVVLEYSVNEEVLQGLNILKFHDENINWAQFIINNRNGYTYMHDVNSLFHNLKQKFDVVIGSVADQQITLLAKELYRLKERVSKNDLQKMKYTYHTNQISFHTPKSLTCIDLVSCDTITTNQQKGDVINE